MTITRAIDDKTVSIQLTTDEMLKADEKLTENTYRAYLEDSISLLNEQDDCAALKHLDDQARKEAIDSMLHDFETLVEEQGYEWFEAWCKVSSDYMARL
jgi:cupin superfamily acireductone dioxygenase involved in methionine salvage